MQFYNNQCTISLTLFFLLQNGYFISMWDLSTDSSQLEHYMPMVREGNVRLKITFSASSFYTLSVVVLAERRGAIAITKDCAVRTTYTM